MFNKICCILVCFVISSGCDNRSSTPTSATGVSQAVANIKTGSDGLTAEQRNIKKRLESENIPGKILHLYIVSAFSGDCLLYSTVQGKVTSSGKRLSPYTVIGTDGQYVSSDSRGISVNIDGYNKRTTEVLQDDGTYGSSIEYLYWWDTKGIYHQQYVQGGMLIHISESPMSWPKIILNLDKQ